MILPLVQTYWYVNISGMHSILMIHSGDVSWGVFAIVQQKQFYWSQDEVYYIVTPYGCHLHSLWMSFALLGICLLEDLRSFLNSVLASHFVLCNIVLEKCHSKGFRHSELCHSIWDRILIYMGCFHKRPNYQENIKSFYTCSKAIWVCECLKAVLGEHQWGSRSWRTWECGWVENRGLLQTCVDTIPICVMVPRSPACGQPSWGMSGRLAAEDTMENEVWLGWWTGQRGRPSRLRACSRRGRVLGIGKWGKLEEGGCLYFVWDLLRREVVIDNCLFHFLRTWHKACLNYESLEVLLIFLSWCLSLLLDFSLPWDRVLVQLVSLEWFLCNPVSFWIFFIHIVRHVAS